MSCIDRDHYAMVRAGDAALAARLFLAAAHAAAFASCEWEPAVADEQVCILMAQMHAENNWCALAATAAATTAAAATAAAATRTSRSESVRRLATLESLSRLSSNSYYNAVPDP